MSHLGGRMTRFGTWASLVGRNPRACAQRMFAQRIAILRDRVDHWTSRSLRFMGRVHVAKQVLAAGLWYHATFVRPLPAQMQEIIDMIMGYVAGGRTVAGRARALFPSRRVSCRPAAAGSVGLVDVQAMVLALQAKLVATLLEPEALPWKTLFRQWLHRPQAFLDAHPAVQPRLADSVAYGCRLIFTSYYLPGLRAPAEVLGYVQAFQACKAHRVSDVEVQDPVEVWREPVCYNPRITDARGSTLKLDLAQRLADAGVRTVGDLLTRGPALEGRQGMDARMAIGALPKA